VNNMGALSSAGLLLLFTLAHISFSWIINPSLVVAIIFPYLFIF